MTYTHICPSNLPPLPNPPLVLERIMMSRVTDFIPRVTPDHYVSIYDVFQAAKIGRKATNVWNEIDKTSLLQTEWKYYKFKGKGQRSIPVINKAGLLKLLPLLPGKHAQYFIYYNQAILPQQTDEVTTFIQRMYEYPSLITTPSKKSTMSSVNQNTAFLYVRSFQEDNFTSNTHPIQLHDGLIKFGVTRNMKRRHGRYRRDSGIMSHFIQCRNEVQARHTESYLRVILKDSVLKGRHEYIQVELFKAMSQHLLNEDSYDMVADVLFYYIVNTLRKLSSLVDCIATVRSNIVPVVDIPQFEV